MIFKNRRQAGRLLAKKIARLKLNSRNGLIVAIPRGGVLVGDEISQKLKIPLSVLVVKKLGAPDNNELAIGATASFGKPVLDQWLIKDLKVSADYLKKEILKKKKEARSREKFLNVEILPEKYCGRNIIVVDDGLATGQTAKMAAKILSQFKIGRLILAIPCAAPTVVESIKSDYDEVICFEESADFYAVGQFYLDFRPVEDDDVKEILDNN
ncbi:hypothetical protein A2164_00605 [Candidatus Curtissbacteria bacterium RBG_13_35_7]|uniref:Phosphoribosyltransferase domain-containing protein n=1 Tax=Candidatus Curtissbacteria bacterium RBG_13_35_7 TaxID=1797705 RepID=A0A1F5G2Z1_9BACT|nr:MAG: hypothetical protein A2164_00605 [Candidatus Curtissbacteria bacterium RBG_13_35_7]